MAEEEVDWGMDESVDVWRQGGGVAVGENEDEISLDGMEGESDGESHFCLLLSATSQLASRDTGSLLSTQAEFRKDYQFTPSLHQSCSAHRTSPTPSS
jgi:hypothetical protein